MSDLDAVQFDALKKSVNRAVHYFIKHCGRRNTQGRRGAVLLFENTLKNVENHSMLGVSLHHYNDFLEKARKKIWHMRITPNSFSSIQGSDSEKEQCGGGIKVPAYGSFALSGLGGLADEACLLSGLTNLGLVDPEFTSQVLQISNNHELYIQILFNAF